MHAASTYLIQKIATVSDTQPRLTLVKLTELAGLLGHSPRKLLQGFFSRFSIFWNFAFYFRPYN